MLMNVNQNWSVAQTHAAIIQMDLSIAPVTVITSQLQAINTFIQQEVQDVKVSMRIQELAQKHAAAVLWYVSSFILFFSFFNTILTFFEDLLCNMLTHCENFRFYECKPNNVIPCSLKPYFFINEIVVFQNILKKIAMTTLDAWHRLLTKHSKM